MPATLLLLPWQRTGEPPVDKALAFGSRFDGTGLRRAWLLITGGVRLYFAVLRAPGALGASLYAQPLRGHYYTVSLWRDRESLLAFARSVAHQRAVRGLAELGPVRGVLISRDADPRQRPTWRDTTRWLAALDPGPYRHQPSPAGSGPSHRHPDAPSRS